MRWVLSSKIHRARVIEADLSYIGSISIDECLLRHVGLWPGERVLVVSNRSGARLETYVIPAPADSGMICTNGACSHLVKVDDEIIIMGFTLSAEPIAPRSILVDRDNKFVRYL